MLALSGALNAGFVAGLIAGAVGVTTNRALGVAAGTTATILTLFFAALSAYQ